jgi:Cof subfamily protein (haloacid dehalogenase superfamily)
VRELEYLSRELPIAMQYFSEKHIYTPQRDIDKYTVLDAYLNNIPLRVRTLEEVGPSVALPKVMFVGDKEDIDRTELLLPEKIKARNEIMRSTPHFLEFLHPEASKGNAVMDLAARLGIAREEVMCIGDNGNDLSMIEAAGCGVAMGNAIPEIKAAADIITSTNNENGVAEAINNVLLQSR